MTESTIKWLAGGKVWNPESDLDEPLKWRKSCRVLVNSMTDLFHDKDSFEFTDSLFPVMESCPHLEFIILTKCPGAMVRHINIWPAWRPYPNVILGTSIEDQATADERLPHLCELGAAGWRTIVSAEPLLGAVKLFGTEPLELGAAECVTRPTCDYQTIQGKSNAPYVIRRNLIHCIIVGGESGPGARPMHPDWARSIRDQCDAAGVPFFFKQWGEWAAIDEPWEQIQPEYLGKNELWLNAAGGSGFHGDRVFRMRRVGKKKAGRLLDGVEHNGWPEPQTTGP